MMEYTDRRPSVDTVDGAKSRNLKSVIMQTKNYAKFMQSNYAKFRQTVVLRPNPAL
jgi:hypothetical protein